MPDPPLSHTDTETQLDLDLDEAEMHDGDEATVVDQLEEPADEADPAPDGLVSPHRPRVVTLPFAVALLFFFGPAVAFVLGNRPEAIDNRPLAALPSVTQGWAFIPEFTTWANDHLPLRAQAVRTGTELSEALFDEPPQYGQGTGGQTAAGAQGAPATPGAATEQGPDTPASAGPVIIGEDGVNYPRVITGSDGWLYFGGDVSGVCNPSRSVADTVSALARLDAAISASGRTLVLAVIPDKSTMVPEHLPGRYAGEGCASARKAEFWDAVTSAGLPLIDMRGPLADAQERTGDPLYRKTDSHWNLQGASVFVEEVVSRLDPGLLAGDPGPIVTRGQVDLSGDLGGMLGTPTDETVAAVTVERPGVTLAVDGQPVSAADMPGLEQHPIVIDASSTGAALYPGSTAVLGDSFYGSARPLLTPFFDQLTMLHNQSDPRVMAQVMVDADTVVIEIVERSVAAGDVHVATPRVLAVIEQELAAHPR